jgi:hypothetical protein
MAKTAAAIGIHAFWGMSAAFDCCEAFTNFKPPPKKISGVEELSSAVPGGGEEEVLRVLLVHPGDLRHAMATVTRRLRNSDSGGKLPAIHFYVLESPMEVLARDILLWEVFLDFEIPIRQRANLFLEIYGNSKVQDRTSRYLERLGERLRDLVVKGSSTLDLVDLSSMKYREKDELESIFRSYARGTVFDTGALRNQRMRGYYEERYDSRRAMIDWDYQYGLHDTASLIHIRLFRDWRETGIAFEFGDQIYSEPNRTLMSYTEGIMKHGKEKGLKKEIRGFWGDIVCSPYFGFGIDCETPGKFEEGLFEILNKGTGTEQHRHHCVEISVYYLLAMMWEAESGRQYKMTKSHDIYSGLGAAKPAATPEAAAPEAAAAAGEAAAADSSALTSITELGDGEEEEEGEGDTPDSTPPTETETEAAAAVAPREPGQSTAAERLRVKIQQRKREEQIAKEIGRAEAIVATFEGVKLFPMHGDPSAVLNKAQYEQFFDVMFVSARAAKFLESPVADRVLRTSNSKGAALVAVETGKFLVPLLKNAKAAFLKKETDYCENLQWSKLTVPPVYRRHRDSADKEDDVLFYVKTSDYKDPRSDVDESASLSGLRLDDASVATSAERQSELPPPPTHL